MFVAIYFKSKVGIARDELGDLILDSFEEPRKNQAKITGGGSGLGASNIEFEVDDDLGIDEVLRRMRHALQSIQGVARDTVIAIEDKVFPLDGAST